MWACKDTHSFALLANNFWLTYFIVFGIKDKVGSAIEIDEKLYNPIRRLETQLRLMNWLENISGHGGKENLLPKR